jgi:Ner family transcriptional regulator
MTQKTNKQDWSPEDVTAALRKKGWTYRSLAAYYGLDSAATIHGALEKPYPKSEARIAAVLDLQPQDIWPSRYTEDGKPKPRKPKRIPKLPKGNVNITHLRKRA